MERKFEILLVEDDSVVCQEIVDLVDESEDFFLVGVTGNSEQALEYVKDSQLDAIILDLELHQGGGNGILFLSNMNKLTLVKKPYILVTTNNSSAITYKTARQLGADFIMSKYQEGYSNRGVLDLLRIMRSAIQSSRTTTDIQNNTPETPEQYKKRIIRRITAELNFVGISPKSVGYTYLVDAIYLQKEQHYTKSIYIIG